MHTGHGPIPGRVISSVHPIPPTDATRLARGRLERSGYSILSRVRCECHDGVLRLSGSLPSHYLKQVALARVAGVEGVRTIVNEIEVLSRVGMERPSDRP